MEFLRRFFGRGATDEDPARVESRRRHLRGRLARNRNDLHRAWTRYRLDALPDGERKRLKADIKHLQAERKSLVKDMERVQESQRRLDARPKG